MDYPSGLGRNPVQILALNVYVLSYHALPRASFPLKTRQEYFFNDQESFDMLKTGFGGTWFSSLFGTPFADFFKGNGPKWGTWPITAPFCPISVAMIFFTKM
jgi:hypothetical protein